MSKLRPMRKAILNRKELIQKQIREHEDYLARLNKEIRNPSKLHKKSGLLAAFARYKIEARSRLNELRQQLKNHEQSAKTENQEAK